MKKNLIYTIILLLSTNLLTNAQWIQTNGPEGGNISSIAISGTNVYATAFTYGFYWSTNNGTNWTRTNSTFPSDTCVITAIGTNVLAGNKNGVYLSTDNGVSWTLSNTGLPTNPRIFSFAVNGTDLFAGTTNGVYLSTDNGTSWTAINNGLSSNVIAITISGTNIFATDSFAIYRSQNNGGNWNVMYSYSNNNFISLASGGANIFAGSFQGNIFKSTNNGVSWSILTSYAGMGIKRAISVVGTNVIAGTSSGLYLSTNNGTSWTVSTTIQSSVNVTSIATDGTNVFTGTDNSGANGGFGIYLSTNNGVNWNKVVNGMLNSCASSLASDNTNIFAGNYAGLYSSTDNGTNWVLIKNDNIRSIAANSTNIFYVSKGTDLLSSTNSGTNWDTINTLGMYVYSVLTNGTNLIAGCRADQLGGYVVQLSTDNGTSWTPKLYTMEECVSVMVANGLNIYVEYGDGIYLSTDNGIGWNHVSDSTNFTTLAASNTEVYAGTYNNGTTSLGIYKSTDDGQTWFTANTGIPINTYVNSLIIDGGNVYAGTSNGFYISTNSGASWYAMNNGFPPYIYIYSLIMNGNELYAGTNGNGVWKCPLSSLEILAENSLNNDIPIIYPNPANEIVNIVFNKYSVNNKPTLEIMDIYGKLIKTRTIQDVTTKIDVSDLSAGVYIIKITNSNGVDIKRLVKE